MRASSRLSFLSGLADPEIARRRLVETGENAQQCALAAAAASDDGEKLPRRDVQFQPAQLPVRRTGGRDCAP